MVFSSTVFLFHFLPAALVLYYLVPMRLKNAVLLVTSLFFYSWGEVRYFPVMLSCIAVNYLAALGMQQRRDKPRVRRALLVGSVVFNLGMLGFFKYSDFVIANLNALTGLSLPALGLTLPLGISFYTFQTMSYTIDVYCGTAQAERNLVNLGAFVVMFPQLIAGPIVRYTDISQELKKRTLDPAEIQEGVRLFILGLGGKVLIANNVGALWREAETVLGFGGLSTPMAWLSLVGYSLQIYFDFSGYSLMAIGMGHMLGFHFPQNFDFPYISRSMTEFWRRWHMTLGSWFREYLYFPLGGNRVGPGRQVFNLFVVWAATGLWHGANWNFVLWGLYFFVLLLVEKRWLLPHLKAHPILAHGYFFFFLMISWVLFAVVDVGQGVTLLSRLFGGFGGSEWLYYLRNYGIILLAGAVLSTPALRGFYRRWVVARPAADLVVLGGILLCSVAYLVDESYNPFLYFRF